MGYAAPLPIAAPRDEPLEEVPLSITRQKEDKRGKRKKLLTTTKYGESHGLGIIELVLAIWDVQGRHVTLSRMTAARCQYSYYSGKLASYVKGYTGCRPDQI